MSGGHWDYVQYRLPDDISAIGKDYGVMTDFPKLAQVFRDIGEELGKIVHDLDYHVCGDTEIKDARQFEQDALNRIGSILKKQYRIRVYDVEETNVY